MYRFRIVAYHSAVGDLQVCAADFASRDEREQAIAQALVNVAEVAAGCGRVAIWRADDSCTWIAEHRLPNGCVLAALR